MKTVIRDRKTPHSVTSNLWGGLSTDLIWAWCFEHDDVNDPLVKKYIPKSQVYVKSYKQDIEDNCFREKDLRRYHVDVWNEKTKNLERCGKFLVNYEIEDLFDRNTLECFM